MGEYHQQQCPLCDTNAEFRNNDSDNYKLFHCSVCITFAISKTAEKRILKNPNSLRNALSKKSQELKDTCLLKIYTDWIGLKVPNIIKSVEEPRSNWNT